MKVELFGNGNVVEMSIEGICDFLNAMCKSMMAEGKSHEDWKEWVGKNFKVIGQ